VSAKISVSLYWKMCSAMAILREPTHRG